MSRSETRLSLSSRPFAVVVLLCLGSAACRSAPERLFDEATRAIEADDYEAAARSFREIGIAYPESPLAPAAHYELARIYRLRIRDAGAAEASLLKILEEYRESPVALRARELLADLYARELHEPAKALPHHLAVLDAAPEESRKRQTLLSLGECYYRLNELPEAASAYRRAAGLPYHPSTDAAYLRLATISRILGEPGEALRLLGELRTRTTNRTKRHEALLAEIEVLMDQERFSEARERLRRAQRVLPHAPANGDFQAKLHEAQLDRRTLASEDHALAELQKTIPWGGGRRRAARDPR